MNTYEENRQTTVAQTLRQISEEGQTLATQKNAAELDLYYTQGARLTAREQFNRAEQQEAFATDVSQQGNHVHNLATNLENTVHLTGTEVGETVTNVANAASNVQITTNAIAHLASDMGGVFNILNASDFGTDVYELGNTANQLIKEVAWQAELASKEAMRATQHASEIIASSVQASTAQAKSAVHELFGTTRDDFTQATTARAVAGKRLTQVSNQEKKAAGTLKAAYASFKSSEQAYQTTNLALNLGITVDQVTFPLGQAPEEQTFCIHFSPFQAPFPTPTAEAHQIPSPVKAYKLFLVPREKRNAFQLPQAETVISSSQGNCWVPVLEEGYRLKKSAFDKIKAAIQNDEKKVELLESTLQYQLFPSKAGLTKAFETLAIDTKLVVAEKISNVAKRSDPTAPFCVQVPLQGQTDIDGDPLTWGRVYVVFLLVELTLEYKRMINQLSDLLLLPSAPFALTQKLPKMLEATWGETSLVFTVEGASHIKSSDPSDATDTPRVEYRCFLLEKKTSFPTSMEGEMPFLCVHDLEKSNTDFPQDLGFYFNQHIAKHVTQANYTIAQAEKDPQKIRVVLSADSTDNFGNLLKEDIDENYIPAVLAVAAVDTDATNQYTDTLSFPKMLQPQQKVKVILRDLPVAIGDDRSHPNGVVTEDSGETDVESPQNEGKATVVPPGPSTPAPDENQEISVKVNKPKPSP